MNKLGYEVKEAYQNQYQSNKNAVDIMLEFVAIVENLKQDLPCQKASFCFRELSKPRNYYDLRLGNITNQLSTKSMYQ